jgi:hypothetical protein
VKKLGTIALMVLWLGACSSPTASPTRLSTSTATQTALDQTGILVGVVDANAALSSPWQPPTAEQARAGVGGNVPEGVSDQMAIYEGQAKLRMPQDVAALQSSWNGASVENTGRDDLTRITTYGKNKAGNIIWSRLDGGPSFNEYPIRWYYDANGALQVLLEQEFGAIPDSKDAAVIFSGDASGPGDSFTFGEKPAIVKDIAALADGTQYYLKYFDFQEAAWKLNPDVLQAMVPDGYTVSQDESGNWIASADNQALLNFDLAQKAWVEALPPLPQAVKELPSGTYSYDAVGLHITVAEGQVIDLPQDQITERLKVGQNSPFQIYNEAGTGIDYAWDAENNVWIDAAKVLQPDNSNAENYIKYDTLDDWLKSARLEKMVITPFDPAETYFPDLTKIYTTDWNNLNSGHYTDSEFNFNSPFGNLPENIQSPFRAVNFVNIGNGASYGFTEQIYNLDGSFTLIHVPLDNVRPDIIDSVIRITADRRYNLPVYFADSGLLSQPSRQKIITWLKTNGYMDSSGNMPEMKVWIDEWLATGYLSPEIENIPILYRPKAFPIK